MGVPERREAAARRIKFGAVVTLIEGPLYGSAKTFDIFTSLVDYRLSTTTCYSHFFADEHLADTGANFYTDFGYVMITFSY